MKLVSLFLVADVASALVLPGAPLQRSVVARTASPLLVQSWYDAGARLDGSIGAASGGDAAPLQASTPSFSTGNPVLDKQLKQIEDDVAACKAQEAAAAPNSAAYCTPLLPFDPRKRSTMIARTQPLPLSSAHPPGASSLPCHPPLSPLLPLQSPPRTTARRPRRSTRPSARTTLRPRRHSLQALC